MSRVFRPGIFLKGHSLFLATYRKAPAGFTLIEILLVLVLIGAVAALSLPNFSRSYRQMQWDQTVSDMVYLMRYAQSRAVSQGCGVRLVFDSPRHSYWLEENSSTSDVENPSAEFKRLAGSFGRTQTIPEEITVDFTTGVVQFFPDGTIEKLTIQLTQGEPQVQGAMCQKISTEIQRSGINVVECSL